MPISLCNIAHEHTVGLSTRQTRRSPRAEKSVAEVTKLSVKIRNKYLKTERNMNPKTEIQDRRKE